MSLLRTALEGSKYSEPESSFTFDGNEYNLTTLLEDTHDLSTDVTRVSDLKWILQYGEPDRTRVDNADITTPLLVVKWNGKLATIDGFHRLTKAVERKVPTVQTKLVSHALLRQHLIKGK